MATIERHFRDRGEIDEEKIYEDLLKNDRGLSLYHTLPVDVQSREKIFSLNSIRGIWSYLKEKGSSPS